MKTIIALATLMALTISAKAEENTTAKVDTTINYHGMVINLGDDNGQLTVGVKDTQGRDASQVYVYKQDSTRTEETWQVEEDLDFKFSDLLPAKRSARRAHKSFDPHSSNFHVGFNQVLDDGADYNLGRSTTLGFNIGIEEFSVGANNGLWIGLGFDWRNYRIDDERWMLCTDKKVVIEQAPDTVETDVARIRTFAFTIPIVYEWQDLGGKPFYIQLGVEPSIAPSAMLKTEYKVGTDKREMKEKHLSHNILGCTGVFAIGYKDWGLWARYTPTKVFSEKHGPELKTLSFGVQYTF